MVRSSFSQAIIFSLLFLVIVWGAFQLSLVEDQQNKNQIQNKSVQTDPDQRKIPNELTRIASITATHLLQPTTDHINSTVGTQPNRENNTQAVLSPTPESAFKYCPPPGNWNAIFIQPGDTLYSLARTYAISPDQLVKANCLQQEEIAPGKILYVPPLPTTLPFTLTPTPCIPPIGWKPYVIQSGDTLISLSKRTNATTVIISQANCLPLNTRLEVGQLIYLPFLPISSIITATPIPWWTPISVTSTVLPSLIPITPNPTTMVPTLSATPIGVYPTSTPPSEFVFPSNTPFQSMPNTPTLTFSSNALATNTPRSINYE